MSVNGLYYIDNSDGHLNPPYSRAGGILVVMNIGIVFFQYFISNQNDHFYTRWRTSDTQWGEWKTWI